MRKYVLAAAAALGLGASAAQAASVVNIGGTGATGVSYAATLTYDEALSKLTVSLKNTTAASLASNITAFVFNIAGTQDYEVLTPNPTNLDSASASNWWSLTAVDQLSDTEDGSPYGTFEAGVGIGLLAGDFNGGGNGTDVEGLASGETGNFVFFINKTNGNPTGNALTASSFISEGSTGGNQSSPFLVRFKGIGPQDDSDKVGTTVVPLPASVWAGMALMSALGAGKWARRRREA